MRRRGKSIRAWEVVLLFGNQEMLSYYPHPTLRQSGSFVTPHPLSPQKNYLGKRRQWEKEFFCPEKNKDCAKGVLLRWAERWWSCDMQILCLSVCLYKHTHSPCFRLVGWWVMRWDGKRRRRRRGRRRKERRMKRRSRKSPRGGEGKETLHAHAALWLSIPLPIFPHFPWQTWTWCALQ